MMDAQFSPPADWLKIRTIDLHTGGEPLRVIMDGFPTLEGDTILEKRRFVKEHYDHLRKALMFEPRGHADMYGCLLSAPTQPEAHRDVLFLHNEGYSTMCGHAVIALATLAVQAGWVDVTDGKAIYNLNAPCGLITAEVKVENDAPTQVTFEGVPSFVAAANQKVEVPGIGIVNYDLAYGGAFYAYVDADALGIAMTTENYRGLIEAGMAIKHAVMAADNAIVHPFEEDLSFLYGTIFTGKAHHDAVDSRNVCIFAEGEVDRSPTGSGVMGRMALHHQQGQLELGQPMEIESILGSRFVGKAIRTIDYGPFKAVIPEVSGSAYITGQHEFLIDPKDPYREGFILR